MDASTAAQHLRIWRIVGVTAMLAIGTYYLLPQSVDELARRTAAIFVVAAIFWATEIIPLFATSLLIIAFEIFFLAHDGGIAGALPARSALPIDQATRQPVQLSFEVFLRPFSSEIIILFLGGFLISAAMVKTGLDAAIASKFLRPFAHRPVQLIFAALAISAFFSMWMSNTATAAMMLAIAAPFVKHLPKGHRFATAMLLAVAFGANIGGIGTPIGSPPNAIALDALRRAGFTISFLDWMVMAVPLMLVLLAITGALLLSMYPPPRDTPMPRLEVAESLSGPAKLTLIVLLIAIALWLTERLHGIEASIVALAAAAALATLRILGRHELKTIDWDVLVLMWGGLSLGEAMKATGLVDYIALVPIDAWPGWALVAVALTITLILGTFMSNTAAATLLVPMALSISAAASEQVQMAVLVALACSFGMAMPVSTPPNAIVFGSGQLSVTAMVRAGVLVGVIAIVTLLLGYQWVLPFVLDRVVQP